MEVLGEEVARWKQQEVAEWPIYALADYDGGGSLLKQLRTCLRQGPHRRNWSELQSNTSDYQTETDLGPSAARGRHLWAPSGERGGARPRGSSEPLPWWRLVEGQPAELEPLRNQLVALGSSLQAAAR